MKKCLTSRLLSRRVPLPSPCDTLLNSWALLTAFPYIYFQSHIWQFCVQAKLNNLCPGLVSITKPIKQHSCLSTILCSSKAFYSALFSSIWQGWTSCPSLLQLQCRNTYFPITSKTFSEWDFLPKFYHLSLHSVHRQDFDPQVNTLHNSSFILLLQFRWVILIWYEGNDVFSGFTAYITTQIYLSYDFVRVYKTLLYTKRFCLPHPPWVWRPCTQSDMWAGDIIFNVGARYIAWNCKDWGWHGTDTRK